MFFRHGLHGLHSFPALGFLLLRNAWITRFIHTKNACVFIRENPYRAAWKSVSSVP